MKPFFSVLLRSALCAAVLSGAVEAQAAPSYRVTDLGTLGGANSFGSAINDLGQVTVIPISRPRLALAAHSCTATAQCPIS